MNSQSHVLQFVRYRPSCYKYHFHS